MEENQALSMHFGKPIDGNLCSMAFYWCFQ